MQRAGRGNGDRVPMATRDLRQSDLTEIGSQGVVSEVLTGKHELNARQIKRLAKRPNNSADALGFALLGESESDHSFR